MLIKFAESLLIGISIAAIPGPIFFELIRRTLSKGLYSGILLVIGEFAGNFLLLTAIFLGVAPILANSSTRIVLYILGAAVLFVISGSALRLQEESVEISYEMPEVRKARESFIAGLGIAVSSPIVIALWVSLAGSYLNAIDDKILAFANVFFIALGFLVFFIPLSVIVYRARHKIPPKYVVLLSKVFGAVLIGYGLLLLSSAFNLHY